MAKATAAYPRFAPVRTDNHPILGKVKVYTFNKYPTPNDDGCQTSFFKNNAKVDNPRQFGFKMFNTSVEAFAAYQRQQLAAREGLAPPVGLMVRWIVKNNGTNRNTVNRWGYETAIADTSELAQNKASILGCPYLLQKYHAFVRNNKLTMWSSQSMQKYFIYLDKNSPNGEYFDKYCAMSDSTYVGSLRMRLMNISLVGTQYDNISTIVDDGYRWKNNPRLRLGGKVRKDDSYMMSNDLHSGNIALWKGNPVVIDFGYHIAVPEYRDYGLLSPKYLKEAA